MKYTNIKQKNNILPNMWNNNKGESGAGALNYAKALWIMQQQMWGIIKLNVEIFENNKLCNLYKTLHLCAKATSQPKASDGRTDGGKRVGRQQVLRGSDTWALSK